MISFKTESLFRSDADAYAHGCNVKGRMGSGIAVRFRDLFPAMYEDYVSRCRAGGFVLGEGYIFRNDSGPHVINLATQDESGAGIAYVEKSFQWLRDSYRELGIQRVAMPKIGTGNGGLHWEIINSLLEDAFLDLDLSVEIH
jgi:O-acetyl-ADP-ribose deacetylase (regulator of RNase III)